jgi:hypothetical protein
MTAIAWVQYVSDNGITYQRKTLADLVTPLGLTSEALGVHARLPAQILARYIEAQDPANGRWHKLRGLDAANAHFTGATATITVPDPSNRTATLTLNIGAKVAEKRYSR